MVTKTTKASRVIAAYQIMLGVYNRCQTEGKTRHETHLAIRDAYPWGERRKWPYKAWLIARREFYKKHGLPLKERPEIAQVVEQLQ